MTTINVHFDGKVLVPDEPVDLPTGSAFVAKLEPVAPAEMPSGDFHGPITDEQAAANPFLRLAKLAQELRCDDDSPADFASQKNHYLYGHPKEP